jgi:hypothetical protein
MDTSQDLVHCPTCDTEYAAGVSICPDDGSLLVAGPAAPGVVEDAGYDDPEETGGEDDYARTGRIEVVHIDPSDGAPETGAELFAREEHPAHIRLVVVRKEDAPDLVDALAGEAIGAKLGDEAPDDGVEVIVHDFQLAEAQAVLVEFTGDPSLVDDVELDPDGSGRGDLVKVFDGDPVNVAAAADRLSTAGIDARLELVTAEDGTQEGSLWLAPDDLDAAREALGIQR